MAESSDTGIRVINWANYIGIPYKTNGRNPDSALDCWGFVVYFYEKEYGITLPKYTAIDADNIELASESLLATQLYQKVSKVTKPKQGDILIFNNCGRPIHVGIAIDDSMMIHCDRKVGSVTEDYRSPKWEKRLFEIVRLNVTSSNY